jgi:hypothetical protein
VTIFSYGRARRGGAPVAHPARRAALAAPGETPTVGPIGYGTRICVSSEAFVHLAAGYAVDRPISSRFVPPAAAANTCTRQSRRGLARTSYSRRRYARLAGGRFRQIRQPTPTNGRPQAAQSSILNPLIGRRRRGFCCVLAIGLAGLPAPRRTAFLAGLAPAAVSPARSRGSLF